MKFIFSLVFIAIQSFLQLKFWRYKWTECSEISYRLYPYTWCSKRCQIGKSDIFIRKAKTCFCTKIFLPYLTHPLETIEQLHFSSVQYKQSKRSYHAYKGNWKQLFFSTAHIKSITHQIKNQPCLRLLRLNTEEPLIHLRNFREELESVFFYKNLSWASLE